MSKPRMKKRASKRLLALPDLEQSKTAVLNSLTSKSGQRSYDRAITDFVEWYCSEPRLAFNLLCTVVLRYKIYLEQNPYAPTTINLRRAAVRRVAARLFWPSDCALTNKHSLGCVTPSPFLKTILTRPRL